MTGFELQNNPSVFYTGTHSVFSMMDSNSFHVFRHKQQRMFSICGPLPIGPRNTSHAQSLVEIHPPASISLQNCASSMDDGCRVMVSAVLKAYCKLPICDPSCVRHCVSREDCFLSLLRARDILLVFNAIYPFSFFLCHWCYLSSVIVFQTTHLFFVVDFPFAWSVMCCTSFISFI